MPLEEGEVAIYHKSDDPTKPVVERTEAILAPKSRLVGAAV